MPLIIAAFIAERDKDYGNNVFGGDLLKWCRDPFKTVVLLLQSEIKFLFEAEVIADGLMLLKLFQQQEISLDLHL